MKILVTGGTGIIGREFLRLLSGRGHEVSATYFRNRRFNRIDGVMYQRMDVTSAKEVKGIFKSDNPDIVVHTASIGNVDFSELNKKEAKFVNVDGTRNILEASEACRSKFIFISSNAIFDGEKAPYREEDAPKPVNYYGRLKLDGERLVQKSRLKYAIVRPILIYGWNDPNERPNPVTWLISKLEKREPVKMVNDIWCNPLLAANCAEALYAVIAGDKEGIYHIGGRERISRYQFAVKAAEVFGLDKTLIDPVPNSYFNGIAPRPKDTTYVTEKMENDLKVRPIGIDDGLELMKADMEITQCRK